MDEKGTGSELTRREIIDRAEAGDKEMLPALREILRTTPGAIRELGHAGMVAREELTKRASGGSVIRKEALALFADDLLAEIAGPDPTPLEKLLAEQVVLCWLHLRWMETSYGQLKDHTVSWGDYVQRCIDRAHRRYLHSIKALSQVRRLF